jgi:F-type H+-transporting ATPase subunit epsilon
MFRLNLLTPEKKLIANQDLEEVILPAFKGELSILPGHAPLMTTLEPGILRYRLKGSDRMTSVAISWGYCQVSPGAVNVLAEHATTADDINLSKSEGDLKDLQNKLANEVLDDHQWDELQKDIQRLQAEINLVSSRSSH